METTPTPDQQPYPRRRGLVGGATLVGIAAPALIGVFSPSVAHAEEAGPAYAVSEDPENSGEASPFANLTIPNAVAEEAEDVGVLEDESISSDQSTTETSDEMVLDDWSEPAIPLTAMAAPAALGKPAVSKKASVEIAAQTPPSGIPAPPSSAPPASQNPASPRPAPAARQPQADPERNVEQTTTSDTHSPDKDRNIPGNVYVKPAEGRYTSAFHGPGRPDHNGIDIADQNKLDRNTPIYLLTAGTVFKDETKPSQGFGRAVYVDHGEIDIYKNGEKHHVITRYGHMYMDDIYVDEGVLYPAGFLIAKMGNNGQSTGPHLHFEIIVDDVKVDPIPILAAHGINYEYVGP